MRCDLTVFPCVRDFRSLDDSIYQITKRSCNRLERYFNNTWGNKVSRNIRTQGIIVQYTIMAKPRKSLQWHYPMIQFLINIFITCHAWKIQPIRMQERRCIFASIPPNLPIVRWDSRQFLSTVVWAFWAMSEPNFSLGFDLRSKTIICNLVMNYN